MAFQMLFDLMLIMPEFNGTAFYFVCGVLGYIAAKHMKRNVAVRLRSGKTASVKEVEDATTSVATDEDQEEDASASQEEKAPSPTPTLNDFEGTMEMLWEDMKEQSRQQEEEEDDDLWEPTVDFECAASDKSEVAGTDGSGESTTEVVGDQQDGVESEVATDGSGETLSEVINQEESAGEFSQPAASDEAQPTISVEASEGSSSADDEEPAEDEPQHQACSKSEPADESEQGDESQHDGDQSESAAESGSSGDKRSRLNWFDTSAQEDAGAPWVAKALQGAGSCTDTASAAAHDEWAGEAEDEEYGQEYGWNQAQPEPFNDGWMQPWDDFMGAGRAQAPCYVNPQPLQQPLHQWMPEQPFVEFVPMLMKVDPEAEDLDPSLYAKVHPDMEVYAMSHFVQNNDKHATMAADAALDPVAPPMVMEDAWNMPWEG